MKKYLPAAFLVRRMSTVLLLLFTSFCYAQAPQVYSSFDGTVYNLYKWEGSKVALLSSSPSLDLPTMTKWVEKMDETYNYYALCNGREPYLYTGVTYINNRSTLAQVPATCGAGCGYIGATGIELQTTYFNNMYNYILGNNQFDQAAFYEFGRNFWFYTTQLAYKTNDPIVTGYAVFMRFMAMEYTGVDGAPFNGTLPFADFLSQVKGLLNTYLSDQTLSWSNTLGVGQGIPNNTWGATDLFASFCFYLKEHYGGQAWVQNVWKYAGLRPDASTTQDAVDNFIIAASQAAKTNLAALFTSWRWPVSTNAINELNVIFNPLPVRIVSFTGKPSQCGVNILEWKTADESNNKGFAVERSENGNSFESLGFVPANNSTGINHLYNYKDSSAIIDRYYYRLRQIDIDGNYDYSPTITVDNACSESSAISIYPNPVKHLFYIKGLKSNANTIKLVGSLGNVLATWQLKNGTSIDLSNYPSGVYFIVIDGNKVFRILKE
jgi:hypothetical protein